MNAADLRRWRAMMKLSQKEAAEALNNTPLRTYTHWECGTRDCPKILPLACAAVTFGVRLSSGTAPKKTHDQKPAAE